MGKLAVRTSVETPSKRVCCRGPPAVPSILEHVRTTRPPRRAWGLVLAICWRNCNPKGCRRSMHPAEERHLSTTPTYPREGLEDLPLMPGLGKVVSSLASQTCPVPTAPLSPVQIAAGGDKMWVRYIAFPMHSLSLAPLGI